MKKFYPFIFFLLFSLVVSGQGGTWTWISGSQNPNVGGVYGSQGVPSVNNHPPSVYEPCEWKDKQGNFWVYSGKNAADLFNALWRFNPATRQWTWMKGTAAINQNANYGTRGVPASTNTPGSRGYGVCTWTDTSGNLWLFGGTDPLYQKHNDLWKYDISTNTWTWVSGDNTGNSPGFYGTQGVPGVLNSPSARAEIASSWTDANNNLWLLGSQGVGANSRYLNDLWKYSIATSEWTWMKGAAGVDTAATYGVKGIANPANDPGGRWAYTKWKDIYGNFWIMGGNGPLNAQFNDVWKYTVSSNEWTWMSGPDTAGNAGQYLNQCQDDTLNAPYSRWEHRSAATDNCGRFWLYGGFNWDGGDMNDLWMFDPQSLKWNWLSGTNNLGQPGNYGTLGVPAPSNLPPSRGGALAWWGDDNKFYLFGGERSSQSQYFCDVWMFDPDTGCVACNATVMPPVAGFQAGKTAICSNDCISFTDQSAGAASWQWNFPGGTPSSSSSQNPQVCYLTAGIYNVTLVASNNGGTDTLTINNYISVSPAPPTPFITQVHNDTLFCSTDLSYTSYQWFLDSTLIPNATDTLLVISKGGNYNVQVANSSGCKIAVGINIVLGLQNYMSDHVISLWPNPAQDKLIMDNGQLIIKSIEIYNVLGEKAYSPLMTGSQLPITIDISTLAKGVYLVQLRADDKVYRARLVKE